MTKSEMIVTYLNWMSKAGFGKYSIESTERQLRRYTKATIEMMIKRDVK